MPRWRDYIRTNSDIHFIVVVNSLYSAGSTRRLKIETGTWNISAVLNVTSVWRATCTWHMITIHTAWNAMTSFTPRSARRAADLSPRMRSESNTKGTIFTLRTLASVAPSVASRWLVWVLWRKRKIYFAPWSARKSFRDLFWMIAIKPFKGDKLELLMLLPGYTTETHKIMKLFKTNYFLKILIFLEHFFMFFYLFYVF